MKLQHQIDWDSNSVANSQSTRCVLIDACMSLATIYAKKHLRKHLNRIYGIILFQSQMFLDDTHTNVGRKAIIMFLIPILVEVIYDEIICSKQGWSTHTRTCTRTYSSTFFQYLAVLCT